LSIKSIWKNNLFETIHTQRLAQIQASIPDFATCNSSYLCIYKYLNKLPESFYCKISFRLYLDFLNSLFLTDQTALITLLHDTKEKLDSALQFIEEINGYTHHDDKLNVQENSNDYTLIQFIDKNILPTYLRLTEGVLSPFVYIAAYISRTTRKSSTNGLQIFNCIEEINKYFKDMSPICRGYNHLIRNGIAHGGIKYKHYDIEFKGTGSEITRIDTRSLIELHDDLLDVCNGLVLAIKSFYLIHAGISNIMPKQLLIEELKEKVESPWFTVDGCLLSELADSTQLIIYTQAKTTDKFKVHYYAFLTGVWGEYLVGGFDRYFISISSKFATIGWCGLNGNKLKAIRENNPKGIEDYVGVVEDGSPFFWPKYTLPNIFYKINTYANSLKIHFSIAINQIKKNFNLLKYDIRYSSIHKNMMQSVVHSYIVLSLTNDLKSSEDVIKSNLNKLKRRAIKKARSQCSKLNLCKHLPIGFLKLYIYKNNLRKRKLISSGLIEDMVCTVQINNTKRIKTPDIMNSKIEIIGKFRICWNKAWIDSFEKESKTE
jgi:hypothetical protein